MPPTSIWAVTESSADLGIAGERVDIEPQAQPLGDHIYHALKDLSRTRLVIDGGLVAARANVPAIGQANAVLSHRSAAPITPRRVAVTAATDYERLAPPVLGLSLIRCIHPPTSPQPATADMAVLWMRQCRSAHCRMCALEMLHRTVRPASGERWPPTPSYGYVTFSVYGVEVP